MFEKQYGGGEGGSFDSMLVKPGNMVYILLNRSNPTMKNEVSEIFGVAHRERFGDKKRA